MGFRPSDFKGKKRGTKKISRDETPVDPKWAEEMSCGPGLMVFCRTVVSVNAREYYFVKARRAKLEREQGFYIGCKFKGMTELPATIKLTRYSCQTCDLDGLPTATKAIRDGISDGFYVKDDPASPLQFVYEQVRTKRNCFGVRIEIVGGGK